MASGDDRDVFAFVEDVCLADLKRLIRHEVGHLRSSETEIDGSVVLRGGDGGVLCLGPVAGVDDNHVRKHSHERDVLHGLMGRSVLTKSQSGVGGSDLHVGFAVADLHADLVVNASGDELGERSGEGDKPCESHA